MTEIYRPFSSRTVASFLQGYDLLVRHYDSDDPFYITNQKEMQETTALYQDGLAHLNLPRDIKKREAAIQELRERFALRIPLEHKSA